MPLVGAKLTAALFWKMQPIDCTPLARHHKQKPLVGPTNTNPLGGPRGGRAAKGRLSDVFLFLAVFLTGAARFASALRLLLPGLAALLLAGLAVLLAHLSGVLALLLALLLLALLFALFALRILRILLFIHKWRSPPLVWGNSELEPRGASGVVTGESGIESCCCLHSPRARRTAFTQRTPREHKGLVPEARIRREVPPLRCAPVGMTRQHLSLRHAQVVAGHVGRLGDAEQAEDGRR